jgi:hypothetical protein
VRDDQPQAAGRERAGQSHQDRDVVLQHLLPDAMGGRELRPWNEIRSIRVST